MRFSYILPIPALLLLFGVNCAPDPLHSKEPQNTETKGEVYMTDASTVRQCQRLGETQPCFPGEASHKDVGLCREGKKTCEIGGVWSECVGAILPAQEDCNNKDDDCDGQIDNAPLTRSCYPIDTKGCSKSLAGWTCEGSCEVGTQTCEKGTWSSCEKAITPPQLFDTCGDGKDNNCDGLIDENCCLPDTETITEEWDLNKVLGLQVAQNAFRSMRIDPQNRFLALTQSPGKPGLHVITLKDRKLTTFKDIPDRPFSLGPFGKFIYIHNGGEIIEYRLDTGAKVRSLVVSSHNPIVDVVFDAGGKYMVVGLKLPGGIVVYDHNTWKVQKSIVVSDSIGQLREISVSPDGKYVAGGHTNKEGTETGVRLWSIKNAKLLLTNTLPFRVAVDCIRFSPNSKLLAFTYTELCHLEVWEITSLKQTLQVSPFPRVTGGAQDRTDLQFSPNGEWLWGTRTADKHVAWNTKTWKQFNREPGKYPLLLERIQILSWAPNSDHLIRIKETRISTCKCKEKQ